MAKKAVKSEDSSAKRKEIAAGGPKKRGQVAKKVPETKGADEEKAIVGKEIEAETETSQEEKAVKDQKQPPKKKAKMAKEGSELLKGEELGETRSANRQKTKTTTPAVKRYKTIDTVVAEAKAAFGSVDFSKGRTLRKRPAVVSPAKASLKKAGTIQKTAKKGKEFVNRGRAKKAA